MLNTKHSAFSKVIWLISLMLICGTNLHAQISEDYRDINVDSLENVLRLNSPSKTELLYIYHNLSWGYLNADDYKNIMYYSRKGISLAEEIGNLYITADLYKNLGVAYDYISQMDSSMIYFGKALETVVQMEKGKAEKPARIAKIKGNIYGSIGNMYNEQGKANKALDYYFKALELFEKYQIDKEIAVVFSSIGTAYFNVDNYEQAEVYFLKKENLCRKNNYELDLAQALLGLSIIYYYKKNYEKALFTVKDALAIFEKHNSHPAYQHNCYTCLSSIYLGGYSDDVKAMEYAELSLKMAKEMELPIEISHSLMLQSEVFLFRKDYAAAKQCALEALQTDTARMSVNQELYTCLLKANIGLGNIDDAGEYFDRFKQSQIAYTNENFQNQLSEMEVKYETEKKELKITALEEEKQLMIWLGIMIGAVLLLTAGLLSFRHRFDIQKRRLAENKIKQLEQEKQLIATQAILDGETQERTRLARDLHDGLGSMLTGVKLSLLETKKGVTLEYENVKTFDKALKLLDHSVQEMRRVAHHLMPDSLSRFGLKPAITDFCANLPSVRFSYYGDESRLDPKLEVMIYRTIHELVNNALKHAGAANIVVQIIQEPDRIAFTVQDDGCGFDLSAEDKGMGLHNIRTRVASYNGIFNIDSQTGEGTEINIEIQLRISP